MILLNSKILVTFGKIEHVLSEYSILAKKNTALRQACCYPNLLLCANMLYYTASSFLKQISEIDKPYGPFWF